MTENKKAEDKNPSDVVEELIKKIFDIDSNVKEIPKCTSKNHISFSPSSSVEGYAGSGFFRDSSGKVDPHNGYPPREHRVWYIENHCLTEEETDVKNISDYFGEKNGFPLIYSNSFEKRGYYIIEFVIPGVSADDLEIELVNSDAESSNTLPENGKECTLRISYRKRVTLKAIPGGLSRMVKIPDFIYFIRLDRSINIDAIKSVCKDGILTVYLQKNESKKKESKKLKIFNDFREAAGVGECNKGIDQCENDDAREENSGLYGTDIGSPIQGKNEPISGTYTSNLCKALHE
jgi:HSP20 family molecular chaperone IbpA